MPTNDNALNNDKQINKNEENNTEENKSFMDYYLSGLKYGIVFGLAIVVGFSLIQNSNETNKNSNSSSGVTKVASESSDIATDSSIISVASDTNMIILPMPGGK